MWLIVSIVALVLLPVAVICFSRKGAVFNLTAQNSTYLYKWTKEVYPTMSEGCARFVAMYVQTLKVRDAFPEQELLDWAVESVNSGYSWHKLCFILSVSWHERIAKKELDLSVVSELANVTHGVIEEASLSYRSAGAKYEHVLRSMPQSIYMALVVKYEMRNLG